MPRSNREYLLRHADQAINDLERGLDRLKMLSDAYGGIWKPMEGDVMPVMLDVPEGYEGQHGKYQKYVDVVAAQIFAALDDLIKFRRDFM